jgi:hypothetical protein
MSPGFDLKDTIGYFPVTKNLALIGEFERDDEVKKANEFLVAILNRKSLLIAIKEFFHQKVILIMWLKVGK